MNKNMSQKEKNRAENKKNNNQEKTSEFSVSWFPGHMAKTRRKITESLPLVDAVAEIADARIPLSSRNPELAGIVSKKPLIILLNKCDIADPKATAEWVKYFENLNIPVLCVDCKSGKGISAFVPKVRELLEKKIEQNKNRGMSGRAIRVLVAGIPNVGKSSFINRISKNSRAKVEDRPGVTRGNQWFSVPGGLELLDTPGVLWPKFEDEYVGLKLAFTGAVKDTVLDIETLAVEWLRIVAPRYSELIEARYKIDYNPTDDPYETLCKIGKKRGMVIRGGEIDTERAAVMLMDEYRGGKLGNITLEVPE